MSLIWCQNYWGNVQIRKCRGENVQWETVDRETVKVPSFFTAMKDWNNVGTFDLYQRNFDGETLN